VILKNLSAVIATKSDTFDLNLGFGITRFNLFQTVFPTMICIKKKRKNYRNLKDKKIRFFIFV